MVHLCNQIITITCISSNTLMSPFGMTLWCILGFVEFLRKLRVVVKSSWSIVNHRKNKQCSHDLNHLKAKHTVYFTKVKDSRLKVAWSAAVKVKQLRSRNKSTCRNGPGPGGMQSVTCKWRASIESGWRSCWSALETTCWLIEKQTKEGGPLAG